MIYRGRRMTYMFGWINIAVRFAMGSPCCTVGKRNARGAKVNEGCKTARWIRKIGCHAIGY
jgi:hypothetical protein